MAKQVILLGGSNIVGRELAERTIASVVCAEAGIEIVVDILVVWNVGYILLDVHEEAEIHTTIGVFLVGAQLDGVGAVDDGVVDGGDAIETIGNFNRVLVAACCGVEVGADASFAVCPSVAIDEHRIETARCLLEKRTGIVIVVENGIVHINRGRDCAFVEEEFAHLDIFLVGTYELRDVFRDRSLEVDKTIVIRLHDARQRTCGFRHRSEVVERKLIGSVLIVESTEIAVVDNLTALCKKHLAAGECAGIDT